MQYNWDWSVLFQPPYAGWLLQGAGWSFAIALPAALLAFALGTLAAVLRTSDSQLLRWTGTAYVQVFRNIPLLVQMFGWYYVLPILAPEPYGLWLKREFPAFATAALAIGVYHGARIGEVLRAGIEALGMKQRQPATALGLRGAALYGSVLLPLAYRASIPPLTSEALAVFKHSSLALTIGVLEMTARSRQIEEHTFHGFEAFAAASAFYLLTTLALMLLALRLERMLRIRGLLAAKA